jgi:hypothetical protein
VVHYYFYVANEYQAALLKAALLDKSQNPSLSLDGSAIFPTTPSWNRNEKEWCVKASDSGGTDPEALHGELSRIAALFGADYDGWDREYTKAPQV